MDANNRYMFGWAQTAPAGGRLLDYGCGDGSLVAAARAAGLDAYGVEKFHIRDHAELRVRIAEHGVADMVRELDGDRIPWPDDHFDLVLSNQVFEHVTDLDTVVDEIARVLKPAGRLVALFPTRETIREGHIGVPFVHWLPQSSIRDWYAISMRRLGVGSDWSGNGDDPAAWAHESLGWLDQYVCYRPRRVVLATLRRRFVSVQPIEEDYAASRLRGRAGRLVRLPGVRSLVRVAVRRLGSVAVGAEKAPV